MPTSPRPFGERLKLPDDLLDWATSIKLVGDDGAHSKQVSREDVTDADRFFEALCDYLYVYRRQYEAFQQRRAAATTP